MVASNAKARILVIDDDPLVAATIGNLIVKAGHDVVVASTGKSGISAFFNTLPDLVLTDMVMPEGGGVDVMRAIHLFAPDFPIIAMTAGSGLPNDLPRLAARSGAWKILNKPFSNDALIQAIAECLTHAKTLKETDVPSPRAPSYN